MPTRLASLVRPRDASVLLTSVRSETEAARLARTVVEERLAVCATILPGARSIYPWKGKLEEARETLLLLKTDASKSLALERRVRALHPYDVPEVLTSRARIGNPDYARWMAEWLWKAAR